MFREEVLIGAYRQCAALLGPDMRTFQPILAEPRSARKVAFDWPRSARAFSVCRFSIRGTRFPTIFQLLLFNNFRFPILRFFAKRKKTKKRSRGDRRAIAENDQAKIKISSRSPRRASWLPHPPHADLLRPRRCAVYEVSSVVEDFRDPPFF
jgi:hypothetical protein